MLIAILLFAGSFGYAHAQTIQKTSKKKATTTASVNKTKGTKVEKSATASKHMKVDGTPDKRYKENKMTAKATSPKKKDGTPDMRYKANKKK